MYYFAYGSNMDRARLGSRLGRDVIGKPGRLAGYKLKFNKMKEAIRWLEKTHGDMKDGGDR